MQKGGEVGMTDREKVIKGLEQFRNDLKPFCGNHADWERFDAGLSMLKEQEAVVHCKDCINRHDSINCQMYSEGMDTPDDWYCADGKRKEVK